MIIDPLTVDTTSSYEDVARLILASKIKEFPIIDPENQLVGMVTEMDMVRVLYPYYDSYYKKSNQYTDFEKRESKLSDIKKDPITKFMRKDFPTTEKETPVLKIGGIMLAKNIHTVPVIENDKLIGLVRLKDIFRKMVKQQLDLEKK